MIIAGNVIDSKTAKTMPFATVFVSDSTGKPVVPQIAVVADYNGNYLINTGNNPIFEKFITASFVGYQSVTQQFTEGAQNKIILTPVATELPGVTITAKAKHKWAIAGAGAVAATLGSFILFTRK